MAKPTYRLRRAIDKEWIRVGWLGAPTFRHQLISMAFAAVFIVPSLIAESWSYEASTATLIAGLLVYGLMIIWVQLRRMAGLGYFSSTRSDRVAKRSQRRNARSPILRGTDKKANGN